MTKDDTQERESTSKPAPSKRIDPPSSCPQCGSGLSRRMFRTGSTQHPGRDMLVCSRCGRKQ